MGGKHNITQYRERLDKVLASHELTNEERLKELVKNQLIHSSTNRLKAYIDDVVDRRTKEVSNFLDMLRSAAVNDDEAKRSDAYVDWKVKQDTQDYRVMYREGPKGSPYHTLLVEGYIDGPLDICLCISTESGLYKKWWPQTTIPPFKLLVTECVQRIGISEQISLVRMKVPWPLSAREALVHYFVFEYFQDDLVIVLLNSLSDLDSINIRTHGFDTKGLPDTEAVRVDLVGGFALQKVSDGRSYFRTIVNMDIKVDFVPPAFINFVSRQLIGSGFRLYQKEVVSVSKGDEDFAKVLKEPLYAQIREALYSDNTVKKVMEPKEINSEAHVLPADHAIKTLQCEDVKVLPSGSAVDFSPNTPVIEDKNVRGEVQEIEEEEIAHNRSLEVKSADKYTSLTSHVVEEYGNNKKKEVVISSEVDQALSVLDKVISMVREYRRSPETRSLPPSIDGMLLNLDDNGKKLNNGVGNQDCRNGDPDCGETTSRNGNRYDNNDSRLMSSPSSPKEACPNTTAPLSLQEDIQKENEAAHTTVPSSSVNQMIEPAALNKTTYRDKTKHAKTNGITESTSTRKKFKKRCCWYFMSGPQMV